MKAFQISDTELRTDPAARGRMAAAVAEAAVAPVNGEIRDLDAVIAGFERRFALTTDQMVAQVRAGTRRETAEIGEWLIYADLRQTLLDVADPG